MNKHTAEFRGKTFTRNSKTKLYTHMVVCRWSYEAEYKKANQEHSYDRENYRYYVKNGLKVDSRGNQVEGLTEDEYVNQMIYKRVSDIESMKEKGCYDSFRDGGWSGRLDLAEKNAAKYRNNPMYCDVHIVEVKVA
jgi:hypothetical protein